MAITASTASAPATARATWFLRIVVWFPTAYAIIIIVHEGGAAHGLSNFFGNLMSASFVGDFSNAAPAMGVPMSLRYGIALLGVIGVGVTLFMAGRELCLWRPRSEPSSQPLVRPIN